MNEGKEVNGLTLLKIPSNVHPSTPPLTIARNDFENTVAQYIKKSSWFVAYLDYRVVIGKYNETDKFVFYKRHPNEKLEAKYLQRIRVFNAKEELHLWRSGQELKGRMRRDYIGEKDIDVVEAHQVLFGVRKGQNCDDAFTEITEDRGTSLILPFTNLPFDDQGRLTSRVCIKTYNYIDYNDIGQATYVDCRFVCFTNGKDCLS